MKKTKTKSKFKPKSKAKAKKEKQALIRARQREEAHMELLRQGWERQGRLEYALKGLSDILEKRAKHIHTYSENLKSSVEVLAIRKQKADESRKLLEEMGQNPPVEEPTTQ